MQVFKMRLIEKFGDGEGVPLIFLHLSQCMHDRSDDLKLCRGDDVHLSFVNLYIYKNLPNAERVLCLDNKNSGSGYSTNLEFLLY